MSYETVYRRCKAENVQERADRRLREEEGFKSVKTNLHLLRRNNKATSPGPVIFRAPIWAAAVSSCWYCTRVRAFISSSAASPENGSTGSNARLIRFRTMSRRVHWYAYYRNECNGVLYSARAWFTLTKTREDALVLAILDKSQW